MSCLLISPSKCPKCDKMSVYFVSCDKCDWVDQEFLDRQEKERKRLMKSYKKWRSSNKQVKKMSRIKEIEDQIPKHLSKTVQDKMRKHLLKDYSNKYRKHRRDTDDSVYLKHKFRSIKERCYYIKNNSYSRYGALGIIVCNEWLNDPDTFIEWALDSGWKRGLTIDRINSQGPYSPSNCRWVLTEEQSQNKRDRRDKVTFPEKGTRTCSKCKVEKPLTDFHRDRTDSHGRRYYCSDCRRKEMTLNSRKDGRFTIRFAATNSQEEGR